jgi:hypothetical protein
MPAICRKPLQHGQGKGGSFARASLRQSDQIGAFQNDGDRLGLDWRWRYIALGCKRLEYRRVEAEFFELSHVISLSRTRRTAGGH